MKKNILYIAAVCMALGLSACSTDPEDAVEKHVYTENEAPYLRTDASANISTTAEFRKGHVSPKIINLKDYAETIQTKLGMTVDDMIAGLETGKVVFYNINTSRGIWDKTAPTKGTTGWYYNKSGQIVSKDSDAAGYVEIDKTTKSIVIGVPETSSAGVSFSATVGFAINNGQNYDNYVRFNIPISVTDPGLIMPVFKIPAGDYSVFEIKFADYSTAIEKCLGMTASEFNKTVQDSSGDIAMYLVDDAGNWDTTSKYTANGIGYWLDGLLKVTTWGTKGFSYFVETHDGSVGVGRAPGVASGTQTKFHFVYASKTDKSKFVEFVCNATLE
ncbi:DUF4859 domain-containing protein [Prevotella sp.]|uniref:DUF4859 domain-containing protein n=1 Tax=Prevotella sp. TaxID=59823 RepID=UPI003DA66132